MRAKKMESRLLLGIGHRLRMRREALRLSVRQLAALSEVDAGSIYRLERDAIPHVSFQIVRRVCNALDMSLEELQEPESANVA